MKKTKTKKIPFKKKLKKAAQLLVLMLFVDVMFTREIINKTAKM